MKKQIQLCAKGVKVSGSNDYYFYDIISVNYNTKKETTLVMAAQYAFDKSKRYLYIYSESELDKVYFYDTETEQISTHKLQTKDYEDLKNIRKNFNIFRGVGLSATDDNKKILIYV